MPKKDKSQRTIDSWMLANAEVNDSYISEQPANKITSLAKYHNIKVQTKKVVVVIPEDEPMSYFATRVIITETKNRTK